MVYLPDILHAVCNPASRYWELTCYVQIADDIYKLQTVEILEVHDRTDDLQTQYLLIRTETVIGPLYRMVYWTYDKYFGLPVFVSMRVFKADHPQADYEEQVLQLRAHLPATDTQFRKPKQPNWFIRLLSGKLFQRKQL